MSPGSFENPWVWFLWGLSQISGVRLRLGISATLCSYTRRGTLQEAGRGATHHPVSAGAIVPGKGPGQDLRVSTSLSDLNWLGCLSPVRCKLLLIIIENKRLL